MGHSVFSSQIVVEVRDQPRIEALEESPTSIVEREVDPGSERFRFVVVHAGVLSEAPDISSSRHNGDAVFARHRYQDVIAARPCLPCVPVRRHVRPATGNRRLHVVGHGRGPPSVAPLAWRQELVLPAEFVCKT